ncbi:hypothetical protein ILUMI_17597 [Ignelater luminosus]|uniref:Uncharacterized protein n=1 Tax=Ignelater luminosus TaxID=2038154 RepID=A0A8K0CMZ9_IGNLU|nr:hypothetical protein ILUMI_17597 [Ignelater luminosus]
MPTNNSEDELADKTHEDIACAKKDDNTQYTIVTDDFNAKIDKRQHHDTEYVGNFGLRKLAQAKILPTVDFIRSQQEQFEKELGKKLGILTSHENKTIDELAENNNQDIRNVTKKMGSRIKTQKKGIN